MMKQDIIYSSIVGYCESLEKNGVYKGNGHHLAQKLAILAAISLLSNQQKDIFQQLSNKPKSAKEIGDILRLSSKHISAQIDQINNVCCIISIIPGKRKMYYTHFIKTPT